MAKIKKVLGAIQSRHMLNSSKRIFGFNLGGFVITLNTQNDYNELIDLLSGLQKKAGIKYEIKESYLDNKGIERHHTLYESYGCAIEIIDEKRFMKCDKNS